MFVKAKVIGFLPCPPKTRLLGRLAKTCSPDLAVPAPGKENTESNNPISFKGDGVTVPSLLPCLLL